jgi:hypothetical protein
MSHVTSNPRTAFLSWPSLENVLENEIGGKDVGFEVIMAVSVKTAVFCLLMMYS